MSQKYDILFFFCDILFFRRQLLAKKLKERLIDEFKYLKNNAQKLNLSRILNIVDITTKDGINDI
ncbi:hypothetical protein HXW14_001779, partial [Campylobacter jejuni]|nr:hypothetical protein [Campylobacter jejuni]